MDPLSVCFWLLWSEASPMDGSQKPEEHINATLIAKVLADKYCQPPKRPERKMLKVKLKQTFIFKSQSIW